MTTARLLGLLIALSSCAVLVSCRTEPPDAAGAQDTAATQLRSSYNIPAKQLHDRVAQAVSSAPINLKIANDENGRITTDWQPYPGAVVGPVSGMGRHWQERTRYTITVAPAWDDPSNKSTLEVAEESQQRPHDKWEWGSQDPIKRPQRAADLAKQIDASLAQSAGQSMGRSTSEPAR
jgi:hypothetical protein